MKKTRLMSAGHKQRCFMSVFCSGAEREFDFIK